MTPSSEKLKERTELDAQDNNKEWIKAPMMC